MNFEAFIQHRKNERERLFSNGLNNGDPHTNGEYTLLETILSSGFDSFLDIGANVGAFTNKALEISPKVNVTCYEPNPQHYEKLSALAQSGDNIHFHAIALSDKSGEATLHVHDKHHETSSLARRKLMTTTFQKNMSNIQVMVEKLDDAPPRKRSVYKN